jgi:hypothetical protein
MKLFNMVRLYDGLVSDMKIFKTFEEAKNYCEEAVENEDVEYQDISYYPDQGQEYIYLQNDFDKERHSLEIIIWPIEVKGIKLEDKDNGNS